LYIYIYSNLKLIIYLFIIKDYNENNVKKLLSSIKKTNAISQLQKQKLFNYCLRLATGFRNKKLITHLKTKYKI